MRSVAMATRLLLPWIWLALLFGYCGASTCGKEFVTAFLKNYLPSQHSVSFELLITGYQPATTVTVIVNKSTFRKTVSVNEKETVSVVVPASSEMRGSNVFDQSVRIQADKEVSVFSVNYKAVTSAATVVYPVGQLGTLYYVVTPAGNHTPQNFKEFAVVANNSPTRVTIHLKGAVTFKGKGYPAGSKLVVDLQAFQAIQLQSSVDLSGTKVESVAPVAVLSGHSCAMQFTTCDHVVEQLLPVSSWGTTFIVPSPLAFQTKFDIVYVIASQNTLIQYHSGTTQGSRQAEAGQVIQFQMQPSQPLYFSADAGIQVLFFYTGAENQNVKHEPFLINIPALTSYCTSYRTGGIRRFANFAVIIAKTSVSCGIRLEKKAITNTEWRPIPGTEYSFAQLPLGRNASHVSVEHPSTPFGLLIFGVSPFIGIGSTALCSCALPCPQNSHYEFCGNGCPASCADRKAPSACKQLCVETCQCNDGYVLSGDKCVPVESCGCTFNGHYYKPGEEFWADETCGYRCTCASTLGRVVCKPADCKDNEACTVVNGVRGCHPISTATCSAAGDPHYAP